MHGPAPPTPPGTDRILVIEDDPEMAGLLRSGLAEEGYAVDLMTGGTEVVYTASRGEHRAVVLDVLLPGPSGFELCSRLRGRGRWVPILMLTALGSTEHRVLGLEAGADDYLTKPFELVELAARIRALVRRADAMATQVLRCGALRLELATHRCFLGDDEIRLTQREHALLVSLLRRPGIVLTRRTLLDQIWNGDDEVSANAVEQTVANVRRKLGRDVVQTVHGVGYRVWEPPPGSVAAGAGR